MKHRILIVVLALGTILGFGSGIASVAHHGRHHHGEVVRHAARICVDAAMGRADRPEHPPFHRHSRWQRLERELAHRCAEEARQPSQAAPTTPQPSARRVAAPSAGPIALSR